MAASAYKGLTIRIGADTTKLSSALRGANSAIFKTQSELNKLNKAARLDPGNNNIAQMQIGALSAQATSAAAKFDMLNKSMEELGNQKASGSNQSIKELADQTDNVALAAENAKDRYNAVDKELANVYTSVKDLSGIDLGKATRESPEAYDKAVQKLREWASEAKNQDAVRAWSEANHTSIEETISDISHMKSVWSDASAQLNDAQLAQSFHNAQVEAAAMGAQINASARAIANVKADSSFANASNAIERVGGKLKVLDAAAESASSRFKRLDEAAKMSPNNIGTMVERSRALADATDVARAKAAALGEKISAYKSAGVDEVAKGIGNISLELERSRSAYVETENEVSRLAGEYDNAQKSFRALIDDSDKGGDFATRFENATKELNRLGQELDKAKAKREQAFDRFDTAKMCSELQQAEDELIDVNARMNDLRKVNFGDIGAASVQAAEQIGQLMREAGGAIVESSNSIDASYRDLRKTFDASEEEYKALYDAAMEYGQANVTSADTMLEMESIAAQLGVGLDEYGHKTSNATEQIRRFAEVAANLDVATNIDSDTIALQMGQIQNVMDDLSPDNIESFGDALVRLGNTMPTQESNIMQITQRLAAVGSVTSFTTPQLMGWAAAIASTGQRSEAAATGISNTITAIQKAVGAGGDALDLFAETAHMDAESFAAAWRDSPTEALKAFIGGLGDLGDEALQKLEDLDITGVRQTQTLLSLAKTVDTVDVAIQNATDAWNGGGDAAAEAGKKAEGFSGTLAKLQNSTQVLAATFGDAMVPWMNRGIDAVQKLTDWLKSLDESAIDTAVVVGGVFSAIAVAGPPLRTLGKNLSDLTHGGLQLALNGMSEFRAETRRLGEAITLAQGGAGTWKEALQATGTFAGRTVTKIESLATSFTNLATSGNLFLGIFGGLALATIADYIRQIAESAAETQRFDNVISDMSGTLDGLSASLWTGKESASKFSDGWSGASSGINDLIASMEEHNRVNKETRDEAVTTIGELRRYGDIVAEAAGKGDEFAGSELELKTAIEGLNEILGTNYTVADVLGGVYLDQAGAVGNLAEKIDQLVEAKKREIRLSAMESIYKEDFQAYAEAENAYDKALDAREEFLEKWKSENMGRTVADSNKNLVTIDESNWESYARQTEGYRDLTQAINETREALNETGEAMEVTEKQWQGYADETSYLTTANFGVREGIIMFNDAITKSIMDTTDWGDKLQDIQPEVGELAQKLQEAKVGASEFADFANNNPDLFAQMIENAGGDIDTLAADLAKYFDEAREDNLEWNGNEWKPVKLEVENYATEALNLASEELRQAIAETDLSVGDLMAGLDNAGVSAEEFASLTSEQFNKMYLDAGGDVEQLVQLIAGLGESEPIELNTEANTNGVKEDVDAAKAEAESGTVEIPTDADTSPAKESTKELRDEVESEPATQKVELKTEASQDATSTSEEQTTTVKVTLDDADATAKLEELAKDRTVNLSVATDEESMQAAADAINSTMAGSGVTSTAKVDTSAATSSVDALDKKLKSLTKTTSVKVTASVTGKERVDALTNALKNVSKKWSATASVTVNGKGAVDDLLRTLSNANGKKYSVTFDTYRVTHNITKNNAKGGMFDPNRIPRHADGIFTRPTLTNIGWVGEDGAELYSGNSLVPLTNRKYSMPYINDISDAVAKKIGPVNAGNQITVTVTGVSGPDEVADAIARRLTMLNL